MLVSDALFLFLQVAKKSSIESFQIEAIRLGGSVTGANVVVFLNTIRGLLSH